MMTATSKLFALMGISLLSFTGFLDATIVSTALPSIQATLHMTVTELQWVMNAFFLGVSAFMASMGRIADMYGRRKVFYIGTIIFGLASFGAGIATQAISLIFFRAIQGIMVAITIPVGIALIHTVFNKDESSKAMGVFGAITGAGLALGPVVGGALVTAFGWPFVFFVNIPFIILGFMMCFFTLNESHSATEMRLDYFGILFLVLTIGSFVFAIVEANNYGWGSPLIKASFIISAVSLVLLFISEAKASHPIIAGSLFKNGPFIASILFTFVGGGLMSVILFIDPLYLSLILNKTTWMTGVLLFIMPLVVMASSPIIGHLNQKYGPLQIMVFGALFYFIAAISQTYFTVNLNYFLLVPAFVIFGLGWAIVNQSPAVAIGQSIHEDHLSVAMGVLFSFYNIGAAVMLAVGVTLFHSQAMQSLLQGLSEKNVLVNGTQQDLLAHFVSQPDDMNQVIQQLNITQPGIQDTFEQAFMAGMHTMYLPLIMLAVMAFVALMFGMKKCALNDG